MTNFGVGQIVAVPHDNRAMIIIGWSDQNPEEVYIIPVSEVNTHNMVDVLTVNANELQPIYTTNLDVGDILEVEGTPAKIVNASAKDLGIVEVAFYKSPIVYSYKIKELDIPKKVASLDITLCPHCGFVITKTANTNCPYKNIPDYKPVEKKAIIDTRSVLKKILNGMDINDYIAKKESSKEVDSDYIIDYSEPLELGTKVRKFGSMDEGIITGKKHNCLIVDWNGKQELCWKQELFPIQDYREIGK